MKTSGNRNRLLIAFVAALAATTLGYLVSLSFTSNAKAGSVSDASEKRETQVSPSPIELSGGAKSPSAERISAGLVVDEPEKGQLENLVLHDPDGCPHECVCTAESIDIPWLLITPHHFTIASDYETCLRYNPGRSHPGTEQMAHLQQRLDAWNEELTFLISEAVTIRHFFARDRARSGQGIEGPHNDVTIPEGATKIVVTQADGPDLTTWVSQGDSGELDLAYLQLWQVVNQARGEIAAFF